MTLDLGARASRLRGQTPMSMATVALGAISIGTSVAASMVLLWVRGLQTHQQIFETMTSGTQGTLLWCGLGSGAAAVIGGFLTYRSAPTRPARRATVTGAVLGAQAVLFSGLYAWFRSGDGLEIFVRQFFRFEVLRGFGAQFVTGARNTLTLALAAEGLGLIIGLGLSLLAVSGYAVVRAPARAYINFFRATPLLWQLSFGFFGMVLGLQLMLGAYQVAILIMGLNAGAYCAEIFRSGIQSIERGQIEAARSLGMPYLRAMRLVILPQAVRRVIPPLTNEFVGLIKDTALVAILGLTFAQRELLGVGRDAYEETFNATPFLASAAGYLVITLPLIKVVRWLESRSGRGLKAVAPA